MLNEIKVLTCSYSLALATDSYIMCGWHGKLAMLFNKKNEDVEVFIAILEVTVVVLLLPLPSSLPPQ